MTKVLVRKSVQFQQNIGGGMYFDPFGNKQGGPSTPLRVDPQNVNADRSTTDMLAARDEAQGAQRNLSPGGEYALPVAPEGDIDPRAYADERAQLQARVGVAAPQSHAERYALEAGRRATEGRRPSIRRDKWTGDFTDAGMAELNRRGGAAARGGIGGRIIGGGLAGALAGLSFLTGLEEAGAAGQGIESGLGGAALRAGATYSTAAPMLQNMGGQLGARGAVGVYRGGQALADRRAARRAPVQVAAPTRPSRGPPVQQPASPEETTTPSLGREESVGRTWGITPAGRAIGGGGPLSNEQAARIQEQAMTMLPIGNYQLPARSAMTESGMTLGDDGQWRIGVTPSAEPTAAPVAVTPSMAAEAFGAAAPTPAAPTPDGQTKADKTAEKSAEAAAAASGKSQSMVSNAAAAFQPPDEEDEA